MTNRLKGIAMVVTAAVMWGCLATIAQIVMQQERIPPDWLITVRLCFSGLIILVWLSLKKSGPSIWAIWRDKRDRSSLIWLGLFGFLAVQYTYFISINLGNGVTTSLLHFLGPAFVLLYFCVIKRRWPTGYEVLILVLASIGTFLLVTNGLLSKLIVPGLAVFWGLVSAISGAFYLIQPVRMIKKWGSWLVTGWGMLIGGVVMNLYAPIWKAPPLTPYALLLISFIVLFGTLLGFVLYLGSLKYLGSVETGILSCIEPFVAAISSFFILQRTFGVYEMMGGILILATVVLISWMKEKPAQVSGEMQQG